LVYGFSGDRCSLGRLSQPARRHTIIPIQRIDPVHGEKNKIFRKKCYNLLQNFRQPKSPMQEQGNQSCWSEFGIPGLIDIYQNSDRGSSP
jgi:hypothetical protein